MSAQETPLSARDTSWQAIWVVLVAAAAPVVLAWLVAVASLGRSVDSERAVDRYLAHEADFRRLIVMLHSQDGRLSGVREAVSLADLVAAGADGASYRSLLARVGAKDLRYFPRSGRIIVTISASDAGFAAMSESYVYTGDELSKPVSAAPRYSLRGPGVVPVSRDLHIKGGWFVHTEKAVMVMSAPY